MLTLPWSFLLLGCPWIQPPGPCEELTLFTDADGDGLGDPDTSALQCEAPGLVSNGDDCDDGDAAITEGDPWYLDTDGDSYGDPGATVVAVCPGSPGPTGYVPDGTDCNDRDGAVNPGADEICDETDEDDDCDGAVEDADPSVLASTFTTFYADTDGDTYGDIDNPILACDPSDGVVTDDTDCDDTDPAYHPGATESCDDPTDFNCDGSVEYDDADGDSVPACLDCDDTLDTTYPDAPEYCDDADNDCDGETDEEARDATLWYLDADSDTFGDPAASVASCTQPEGYVQDATDCDDGADSILAPVAFTTPEVFAPGVVFGPGAAHHPGSVRPPDFQRRPAARAGGPPRAVSRPPS